MLDCVLISTDDDFRRQVLELTRLSDGHGRLVLDLDDTAEALHRDAVSKMLAVDPHVIFIDLGETSTTGVRVLEALSQEAPDIGLVVAGPQLTADALLEVMRAGASEYLPRPLGSDDVGAAFARVRRRITPTPVKEEAGARGRVITIFSAKGGTGVTVTAANLAIVLEEMTRKSTLLLDLTPALGTAALVMGLQARYSYLDVIRNFHRIDEELLRSFLEVHESGVSVLSSPPSVSGAETPTSDQILGLVRLCRRHFAYVVVDGGSTLTGPISTAIAESDERILLTTPELPALRNQKKALEQLQQLRSNGKPPAQVVLTQYREGMGVSPREVEEALGQAVFQTLEWDDETVIRSMNAGRPAVLGGGRSRFARGLNRLGDELAGADRAQPKTGGLFGALLRPFRTSK